MYSNSKVATSNKCLASKKNLSHAHPALVHETYEEHGTDFRYKGRNGAMQINSTWLPKIAAYGYTKHDIQYDACKNVLVGTWILGRGIAEGKDIWSGVGNYNSHTPNHNRNYRNGIYNNYKTISFFLKN